MNKKHTLILIATLLSFNFVACSWNKKNSEKIEEKIITEEKITFVDSIDYLSRIRNLANGDTTKGWLNQSHPIPYKGAILPYNRIIAYYGNLYSKRMGILGELSPEKVHNRLDEEIKNWEKADNTIRPIRALHYIAVTAQGSPGKDGKYRLRMPFHQIDSILAIAKMRKKCLVFLDIQVGLSTIQEELPRFKKYLLMPNVHLGIDPEFSMKTGVRPGKVIGTMNANDINFCSKYLDKLVKDNHLPPKVLVVHRFTTRMLRNYKKIKMLPSVQIVINMDGWGSKNSKFSTYKDIIYKEPVQFTGFKIFYKNDLKNYPNKLTTPEEILTLKPQPIYIQYQ